MDTYETLDMRPRLQIIGYYKQKFLQLQNRSKFLMPSLLFESFHTVLVLQQNFIFRELPQCDDLNDFDQIQSK